MKNSIQKISGLLICFVLTFASCKKSDVNTGDISPDNTVVELGKISTNQANFAEEMDESDAEINELLSMAEYSLDGIVAQVDTVRQPVCGSTVIRDTLNGLKRLVISYNGQTCNFPRGSITRSGSIIVSMPLGVRWVDAGAALTVSFNQFSVTKITTMPVPDTGYVLVNGSKTLTNITGGRLGRPQMPATLDTIIHEVFSPGMQVSFGDGTSRNWQVHKRRTFISSPSGVTIKSAGLHNDGSSSSIMEWGTDRLNVAFTSSTPIELVATSGCGFRIVSGEVFHKRGTASVRITFGCDSTGAPLTGCAPRMYRKIVYTDANGNVAAPVLKPY
jgi:hypothetical protein